MREAELGLVCKTNSLFYIITIPFVVHFPVNEQTLGMVWADSLITNYWTLTCFLVWPVGLDYWYKSQPSYFTTKTIILESPMHALRQVHKNCPWLPWLLKVQLPTGMFAAKYTDFFYHTSQRTLADLTTISTLIRKETLPLVEGLLWLELMGRLCFVQTFSVVTDAKNVKMNGCQ